MRNRIWHLIVYFFLFSLAAPITRAHPLDVSSTVITLHDITAVGKTYLHNYEVTTLLSQSGKNIREVADLYAHREIIESYFLSHFSFSNHGVICETKDIDIPQKEGYEVLTSGLEIGFTVYCPEKIEDIWAKLDFFTNFDLQTNRLYLVEKDGTEVFYKVGTHKITELFYKRGATITFIDTDTDGISDEEEKVYHTDPSSADTDQDYFTDGEEINNGWNPLSKSLSPGQIPRYEVPKTQNLILPKNLSAVPKSSYDLNASSFWGDFFQSLLKRIGKTISKEESHSFLSLFLLVTFLGFLHALGPGHAKALLWALMIHKKASLAMGMRFIGIFSLTHILDILLLFVVLKFLLFYWDAGALLSSIQKISAVLLVFFWLFLLYRAVYPGLPWEEGEFRWKTWILGIIAGLAPCSFGWSLFFLLLSLGKVDWIPWFIAAIGLWIFLCLFLLLFAIYFSRKVFYHKLSGIARYSSYFSAGFILLLGIVLTYMNFIV